VTTSLHELQIQLADIKAARLRLALGEQATTVREADGSTVIYAQPSDKALEVMQQRIETEIAGVQGVTGVRRAPIYMKF
jgi:hypothetical protein